MRRLGAIVVVLPVLFFASFAVSTEVGGQAHAAGGRRLARVAGVAAPLRASGWVAEENRRPGTAAWRIPDLKTTAGIDGYADHVSVAVGESVGLYVSSRATTFHVEAYRMGFYGGAGARLVWRSGALVGVRQPDPVRDTWTHLVEARWRRSLVVAVGQDWPPGDYLFKLVGSDGAARYVPLTVRDDDARGALVLLNAVTTWQAYNLWGGADLYEGPSGRGKLTDFGHRSRVVSFDRPYAGDGSGSFLGTEYPLVAFAESLGLDLAYWTDVDLHERPAWLLGQRALLSLGHDEYWSTSMRLGAADARDGGVNLAFFGANAVFRHIRFETSLLGADRHEVNYKRAAEDPLLRTDRSEVTADWRQAPLSRPESDLVGDLYECNPVKADMVVTEGSAWVFAGTGLADGDHIPNLVGPEYDRVQSSVVTPHSIEVLAHSPVRCHGKPSYSDMSYYVAPSGAGVFATGTNWWICALVGSCPVNAGGHYPETLQRMTENVLRAFAAGPAGLVNPSIPNLRRLPTSPPISVSGEQQRTSGARVAHGSSSSYRGTTSTTR